MYIDSGFQISKLVWCFGVRIHLVVQPTELDPPPYDSDSVRADAAYHLLSGENPQMGMDTGYTPAPPVFSSQQQQQQSVRFYR